MGNTQALESIADQILEFKKLNSSTIVVVDPVLGDNGRLYVAPELIPVYQTRLCALADVITPNGFEAEYEDTN